AEKLIAGYDGYIAADCYCRQLHFHHSARSCAQECRSEWQFIQHRQSITKNKSEKYKDGNCCDGISGNPLPIRQVERLHLQTNMHTDENLCQVNERNRKLGCGKSGKCHHNCQHHWSEQKCGWYSQAGKKPRTCSHNQRV